MYGDSEFGAGEMVSTQGMRGVSSTETETRTGDKQNQGFALRELILSPARVVDPDSLSYFAGLAFDDCAEHDPWLQSLHARLRVAVVGFARRRMQIRALTTCPSDKEVGEFVADLASREYPAIVAASFRYVLALATWCNGPMPFGIDVRLGRSCNYSPPTPSRLPRSRGRCDARPRGRRTTKCSASSSSGSSDDGPGEPGEPSAAFAAPVGVVA